LFVWQPIPALGETPGRRAREVGRTSLGCARKGYEAFARSVATEASGSLLWLADLPRGRAETLTVDDVHYTAAFSREIASEIGKALAPAR
ncbi:MAG TPA: hypothetical protein VLH41_00685, partial [Thermoanaerobaculia bacterium]|nr:hypothetical protein [Thermoanaerobaculia bacterium]